MAFHIMIPDAEPPAAREGIIAYTPDETGLYPWCIRGSLRHEAYVWATSLVDAQTAVALSPLQYPRYWSETTARDAKWASDGEFDDCQLYRIWRGPRYVLVTEVSR